MTDAAALLPLRSQWRPVWERLRGNRAALAGAALFAGLLVFVSIGPILWMVDPWAIDPDNRNQGPSLGHPLGTDQLGRDLLARLMVGGRITLAVGVMAMLIGVGLGTLVGVMAGYFRRLDGVLMRLTDLFLALPMLPILLVLVLLFREALAARLGEATGIFLLVVGAIGLTSWMHTARIVRADVMTLKERDFITAAQAIGTPPRRIITRHVLPNVLSPVIVSATLGVAGAIMIESALSFLGMGFPPDVPTWGRMVHDAVDYLQQFPGRVLWPGAFISLTVLSVNYLGDGLRAALDPRGI